MSDPGPVTFIIARQPPRALAETMFIESFGIAGLALGWSKSFGADVLGGVQPRNPIEDTSRELPRATIVLAANRWEIPGFLASGRVAAAIDRYALMNWGRRGGQMGFWLQGLPEVVAKLPADLEVRTSPVLARPRCVTFGSARTQLGLAGLLARYVEALA